MDMDLALVNRKFKERYSRLKSESIWKGCFHENHECSDRIIKAHSIQNNRILNKISENGDVFMYTQEIDSEGKLSTIMKEQGRAKATTFPGFCGYHDNSIFKPIEEFDYQPGNKEQEFLFAYRALAKEYHAKMTTTEMYRKMIYIIRSGDEQKIESFFGLITKQTPESLTAIENILEGSLFGSEDAEQRIERMRVRFNGWLDESNFDELVTEVIEFPEEYPVAVSSITYIEKDLKGNTINDLADFEIALAPLFITVFPQNGKTFVLLTYLSRNKRRYKFIREQILTLKESAVKRVISNMIIAYIENFAVSPKKWRKLKDEVSAKANHDYMETVVRLNKTLSPDYEFNILL